MILPVAFVRAAVSAALLALCTVRVHAELVISEFMAANTKVLADSDGQYSDWIEVYNAGAAAVDLAGWYLTDDAKSLTKWQFPDTSLAPGGYLVVFASDKNRRDPTKELHTNFTLGADGEFLGLVMPDGKTIVSQFSPKYPSQFDDVSYGITQPADASEASRPGYFRTPTPGMRNGGSETLLLLERVTFSREPGPFAGAFTLTMSGAAEGQRIRYVLVPPAPSGALVPEPTAAAVEYTGPIAVSASAIISAAVFSGDSRQQGYATTAHYMRLGNSGAARVDTFASQLPLMVIDTHGYGPLIKDSVEHPAWLYSWNRPAAGGTALSSPPSATSTLTINVRGSSSAEFPKKGFAVGLTDGAGKGNPLPLYGLPSFDSWVLVGPWSFDATYLHNVVMYGLSNRLGRWAPRTQLFELFLNTNGGDLDYGDYAGIYVLSDALRVDKKRVDITSLDPKDVSGTAVTGGYLMKSDVPAADDFSFRTRRNIPAAPNALIVTSPNAGDLVPAQREYIQGYVQSFEDALFADSAGGWRQHTHLDFIDRDSWVDYHILNTLSMNADALVRSAYLTKDRREKLVAGPLWDYDRALGGGDPRTRNPELWYDADGTNFWTSGWWGVLAHDPEFMQAWIDRWQVLRRKELSSANVAAMVDGYAAQIGVAAAARDAARWPDNVGRFGNGWTGEIDNLKDFLAKHSAWIDGKFNAAPTILSINGVLTVTPAPGTQLAYTTDGTDPRAPGGAVSTTAAVASSAVRLPNVVNLQARSYTPNFNSSVIPGSAWSSAIGNPGRLINLSILTDLAAADTFTMGFVVGGAGTIGAKALLARAAGPSLVPLGVTSALPDPKLEFYAGATKIAENNDWNGAASIANVFAQVGAFAYVSADSKDAAVFDPAVAPGNNSVVVSGIGAGGGTVIAELYDASPADTVGTITPRLINVSVLKNLGAGLTAGFVIGGGSAKNVLIRGIGPTLGTAFGVTGVVADPKITLFGANSVKIGENDDWGGTTALTAAFAAVGAFALPSNSRDAALLVTLAPGSYTVQVSGDKANSGIGLVEVYEVPE